MSTLLDTNILEKNSIGFHNLSVPTTSGGTTYGKGTAGQILKSNGSTVYWGDPVDTALPTRHLDGYYNPDFGLGPIKTFIVTAGKTYTANLTRYTAGYGYFFLKGRPGQNNGKYHSSLPLDTENNRDPYEFVVRPGETLTLEIGLENVSGLLHNGSVIYDYKNGNAPIASVILSTSADPEIALDGTNLLAGEFGGQMQMTNIFLPFKTSQTSIAITPTMTYSYTNSSRRIETVYLHIILTVNGSPIYNIRKVSGGEIQYSGTLTYVLKANLAYVIEDESDVFPLGSPYYNYATDGYVIIRDEDSITAMLPETFFVKRGNFCYKIDSSGIKKSTNGGAIWT